MTDAPMRRKVMIVFEELEESVDGTVPGGKKFNVYLSGDIERIGKTNSEDLSAAEWWALRMFQTVKHTMSQAGAATQPGGHPVNETKP